MVFLVVDQDGNESIVKVDNWEEEVTDPSAPEEQYAAVEEYLSSQGIDATVVDHAIKAGSYQGNSGGGIFLSDGSRVLETEVSDYWFGEAWTGKAFNGPNVDYEIDFNDLPDSEDFVDQDLLSKVVRDVGEDNDNAEDESGNLGSNNLGGTRVAGDESELTRSEEISLGVSDNSGPTPLSDLAIDNFDLFIPEETVSGGEDVRYLSSQDESSVAVETDDAANLLDLGVAIESGDVISEEDDLLGVVSDSDALETGTQIARHELDSSGLEENLRLDLDDADSTEHFD